MYHLLETIRCDHGQLQNLSYHNARLNRSRQHLWGATDTWDLAERIGVPPNLPAGVYKCRVIYGLAIEQVVFEPYSLKPIESLQLVEAGALRYDYKYADRSSLTALKAQSAADDVLILQDGLLTDTSYANVALWDGSAWYTPQTPLLHGTRRAELLAQGVLREAPIRQSDLLDFEQIRLFNAMIHWAEGPTLAVSSIWPLA